MTVYVGFYSRKNFSKKKIYISAVWVLALRNFHQPCLRPIIIKYIGLKGHAVGARMSGAFPACERRQTSAGKNGMRLPQPRAAFEGGKWSDRPRPRS